MGAAGESGSVGVSSSTMGSGSTLHSSTVPNSLLKSSALILTHREGRALLECVCVLLLYCMKLDCTLESETFIKVSFHNDTMQNADFKRPHCGPLKQSFETRKSSHSPTWYTVFHLESSIIHYIIYAFFMSVIVHYIVFTRVCINRNKVQQT
jgi:hypothetical protein